MSDDLQRISIMIQDFKMTVHVMAEDNPAGKLLLEVR
jgi:hypothetical protein